MNRDYRPGVKNGAVQRRRPPAGVARRRRADRDHHLGPLIALVLAGMAITGGFIAGLHTHFAAQRLSSRALLMKQQLDEARTERRDLEIKEQRGLSFKAIQRRVGGSRELAPFQLDRPEILRSANPSPGARRWATESR
jgi:hypothetical protein